MKKLNFGFETLTTILRYNHDILTSMLRCTGSMKRALYGLILYIVKYFNTTSICALGYSLSCHQSYRSNQNEIKKVVSLEILLFHLFHVFISEIYL